MKRLFFLFLFAFAAFAFIGCSEDDDDPGITPTSVEPYYIYAPIEYYAPLSDSERTSYGASLRSNGFDKDLEDESYSKEGSTYLAASIEQYGNNNYYLILMAVRDTSSKWNLPITQFPTIPLGVARVAEGYSKYYETGAAGYFLYLKNQHIDNGDERYYIDGDEAFCSDSGAEISCSVYVLGSDDFSIILKMDRAFFQAISAE